VPIRLLVCLIYLFRTLPSTHLPWQWLQSLCWFSVVAVPLGQFKTARVRLCVRFEPSQPPCITTHYIMTSTRFTCTKSFIINRFCSLCAGIICPRRTWTHQACWNTHRVYGNTIECMETPIERVETPIERGETLVSRGETWGCTEALPKGGRGVAEG
jgi:hypothetical protein